MHYTTLGRTGLRVSVAGLGCGGSSRLGQSQGRTEAESVAIIHAALDAGINFIDTAASYGTESIVGKALKAIDRDQAVVSTKAQITRGDTVRPLDEILRSLDNSLATLATDYIDIFHLHGVPPSHMDYALNDVVPALESARTAGKIRYLGITETPPIDADHNTLMHALQADCFDVIMLAFHMLHQSARQQLFPSTQAQNVGTLIMFAVRTIFSRPQRLQDALRELARRDLLSPDVVASLTNDKDPFEFLFHDTDARDIIDAAYRYCRHQPGSDVVLFGTGNRHHLAANIASINAPPLPASAIDRLHTLFGHIVGVGLDRPSTKH